MRINTSATLRVILHKTTGGIMCCLSTGGITCCLGITCYLSSLINLCMPLGTDDTVWRNHSAGLTRACSPILLLQELVLFDQQPRLQRRQLTFVPPNNTAFLTTRAPFQSRTFARPLIWSRLLNLVAVAILAMRMRQKRL